MSRPQPRARQLRNQARPVKSEDVRAPDGEDMRAMRVSDSTQPSANEVATALTKDGART